MEKVSWRRCILLLGISMPWWLPSFPKLHLGRHLSPKLCFVPLLDAEPFPIPAHVPGAAGE